jgi:hypothetical protein
MYIPSLSYNIRIFYLCQDFLKYFSYTASKIAHNVPAVCDGLTARIEKCVAFLGLVNCGCSEPWEWSVRSGMT